ncbi:MAG: hypothetical protein WCD72_04665 [Dehalococcoidia bacterium]
MIKKLTCHSERDFLPCHSEGALRLCHPEGTEGPKDLAQDKTPRPKNLAQGKLSEESGDPSLSLRTIYKHLKGEADCKK